MEEWKYGSLEVKFDSFKFGFIKIKRKMVERKCGFNFQTSILPIFHTC
jgi:hypothetical protein